jgi:hypothetical protein
MAKEKTVEGYSECIGFLNEVLIKPQDGSFVQVKPWEVQEYACPSCGRITKLMILRVVVPPKPSK